MKQLNTKLFFTVIMIAVTSSCAFFEPYKVPIMQGNIFEEKDINKLEKGNDKNSSRFLIW
jgi:outer membrane protein assembly factor BamE